MSQPKKYRHKKPIKDKTAANQHQAVQNVQFQAHNSLTKRPCILKECFWKISVLQCEVHLSVLLSVQSPVLLLQMLQ
jgi:hypothetical protein